MASHKNQHFVPRCYLRPFTLDGENNAINLFNLDRCKEVVNAPVKNQCAGDYFYGKDLKIENALKAIEGAYADALRIALRPGYGLLDEHRSLFRRFWLLQHMRTEAASRRSMEMMSGATGVFGSEFAASLRMELKEAVEVAMHTFVRSLNVIDDLKVVLVRNHSDVPFITSDDPAILTSRWHFHTGRARSQSFGLGSAGAIVLLPISPEVPCVGYDGDVYSMQHDRGWVLLKRDSDVHAFNEHQFLNCWANVYYRGADPKFIGESYARIKELRPRARHELEMLLPIENGAGRRIYRVGGLTQAKREAQAIIHWKMVHPSPAAWPSQLSWRHNGSVYTNGTALGYVRESELAKRSHAADERRS